MNVLRKLLLAGASFMALSAPPANAVLQFAADLNGVAAIRCTDNQAAGGLCPGDINPAIGTLAFANGVFGGLIDLQGSVQTVTNGVLGILNSSSLQITALGNVHIDAAVGATGYTGPANTASVSASGTIQGIGNSTAYSWFNDPANGQGADNPFDTPGGLLDTFSFTSVNLADAYAHSLNNIVVNDPGTYSMTQTFTGDLLAGAVLVGNSQQELKANVVPEPGTLGMLGTALGLLWFGNRVYRRREENASIG